MVRSADDAERKAYDSICQASGYADLIRGTLDRCKELTNLILHYDRSNPGMMANYRTTSDAMMENIIRFAEEHAPDATPDIHQAIASQIVESAMRLVMLHTLNQLGAHQPHKKIQFEESIRNFLHDRRAVEGQAKDMVADFFADIEKKGGSKGRGR